MLTKGIEQSAGLLSSAPGGGASGGNLTASHKGAMKRTAEQAELDAGAPAAAAEAASEAAALPADPGLPPVSTPRTKLFGHDMCGRKNRVSSCVCRISAEICHFWRSFAQSITCDVSLFAGVETKTLWEQVVASAIEQLEKLWAELPVRHKNKFRDYAYMLFVGHEAEHGETMDPHEKEEASDERQIALAKVNEIAGERTFTDIADHSLKSRETRQAFSFSAIVLPQSSCATPSRTWQATHLEKRALSRSLESRARLSRVAPRRTQSLSTAFCTTTRRWKRCSKQLRHA